MESNRLQKRRAVDEPTDDAQLLRPPKKRPQEKRPQEFFCVALRVDAIRTKVPGQGSRKAPRSRQAPGSRQASSSGQASGSGQASSSRQAPAHRPPPQSKSSIALRMHRVSQSSIPVRPQQEPPMPGGPERAQSLWDWADTGSRGSAGEADSAAMQIANSSTQGWNEDIKSRSEGANGANQINTTNPAFELQQSEAAPLIYSEDRLQQPAAGCSVEAPWTGYTEGDNAGLYANMGSSMIAPNVAPDSTVDSEWNRQNLAPNFVGPYPVAPQPDQLHFSESASHYSTSAYPGVFSQLEEPYTGSYTNAGASTIASNVETEPPADCNWNEVNWAAFDKVMPTFEDMSSNKPPVRGTVTNADYETGLSDGLHWELKTLVSSTETQANGHYAYGRQYVHPSDSHSDANMDQGDQADSDDEWEAMYVPYDSNPTATHTTSALDGQPISRPTLPQDGSSEAQNSATGTFTHYVHDGSPADNASLPPAQANGQMVTQNHGDYAYGIQYIHPSDAQSDAKLDRGDQAPYDSYRTEVYTAPTVSALDGQPTSMLDIPQDVDSEPQHSAPGTFTHYVHSTSPADNASWPPAHANGHWMISNHADYAYEESTYAAYDSYPTATHTASALDRQPTSMLDLPQNVGSQPQHCAHCAPGTVTHYVQNDSPADNASLPPTPANGHFGTQNHADNAYGTQHIHQSDSQADVNLDRGDEAASDDDRESMYAPYDSYPTATHTASALNRQPTSMLDLPQDVGSEPQHSAPGTFTHYMHDGSPAANASLPLSGAETQLVNALLSAHGIMTAPLDSLSNFLSSEEIDLSVPVDDNSAVDLSFLTRGEPLPGQREEKWRGLLGIVFGPGGSAC